MLPIIKGIKQRGKATQIEDKCPEPKEMAGKTVQLNGDNAKVLGPLWHLDAHSLLDNLDITLIIGKSAQIIQTGGIGHKLCPGPVLPHLFMHPVDIAKHRFGVHDILTIHGQLDP